MKKRPMCDIIAAGLTGAKADFEVTRVDSDISWVTRDVCTHHLAKVVGELTRHNKNFVTVRRYLDEEAAED